MTLSYKISLKSRFGYFDVYSFKTVAPADYIDIEMKTAVT